MGSATPKTRGFRPFFQCGALFTELARREVARIDRLLEEGCLVVGPELADVWISLDYRVPELLLIVAEHLLLLDLLDIDVVDGGEPIVEGDRSADGVKLDASHG